MGNAQHDAACAVRVGEEPRGRRERRSPEGETRRAGRVRCALYVVRHSVWAGGEEKSAAWASLPDATLDFEVNENVISPNGRFRPIGYDLSV